MAYLSMSMLLMGLQLLMSDPLMGRLINVQFTLLMKGLIAVQQLANQAQNYYLEEFDSLVTT